MLILAIRSETGSPQLSLYDDHNLLTHDTWSAERDFARSLPEHVQKLCLTADKKHTEIQGIVCFAGPGSFTGLRIGHSYANALSYALSIPVVSTATYNWLSLGITRLESGDNQKVVIPEYGAEAHITPPRIK